MTDLDNSFINQDCPALGGPVQTSLNCNGCIHADTCLALMDQLLEDCKQKYQALSEQLEKAVKYMHDTGTAYPPCF